MNIRIVPAHPFAKVRALPDGRATAPAAVVAVLMLALILTGFTQRAVSPIPRTAPQPNRSITKPPHQRSASRKPGAKTQPVAPNLAKEPTLYVVGYAHLD